MTGADWRAAAERSAYSEFEDYVAAERWDFAPGDRIGPPLTRLRLRRALRGAVALLVVAGAGWAYSDDDIRPTVQSWAVAATGYARAFVAQPAAPAAPKATAGGMAADAASTAMGPGAEQAAAAAKPAAPQGVAAEEAAAVK